ncbi:CobW family GTP-binding protein [Candidatus Poriferisodalis sp.]|uniref:CobW family GTP-binding protein n=1 Tax=Candidatus Poriferisodalis sp. TaxID=3101277 RepID=UPI003B0202C9
MNASSEPGSAPLSQSHPDQLDAAWQAVLGSLAAARRNAGDAQTGGIGVTVLTGFLGSGKTTVLRRLLADPAGLRIAAVVNDIGAVNIDAVSIDATSLDATSLHDQAAAVRGPASRSGERMELTNGCACCALVDDLSASLEALAATGVFDAIVVEASGVSDPATMASAVEGASGCRLDGVVAVVDAQCLAAQLDDFQVGFAVRRQIYVAHLVVLSKTDLVDDAQAAALTARIGEIAPGRMVVPSTHGRIDPRVLLSAAVRGAAFDTAEHRHPIDVATATVAGVGPWEPAAVGRWCDQQPEPLLRVKGWFTSADGRWHELQVVGRRWSIEPARSPAGARLEPAVVLIGCEQSAVDRAAASLCDLA